MSLRQVALVFQIAGFMLATIFAGIIFNREMLGRLYDGMNSKFINLSNTLREQYLSLAKYLEHPELVEQIGSAIVRSIALTFAIVGCLNNISWLFWLGIFFCSVYIIITVVLSIWRQINMPRYADRLWLYPLFIFLNLLITFLIAPLLLILFFLFVLLHGIITLSAVTVVEHGNVIRKALIVLGSLLLFIGLILELIYAK